MARTSYGSITITETTDIKTFVRYSENSDGRNYVATPTSTTKYIGVYVGPDGTEANPPAYNNSGWKWSKYQGNSIGSVETKFINWATNIEGNKPTTSAAWQTAPPAYDASKPYYYVWTRITYSDASPTDNIYLDAGVSEAVVKSAQALSVATNVAEDAQGAIAIARAQEQHFWFNATDIGSGVNLIESGAYITDTAIDTFKSGKNGGYLLTRSDKVEMGKASAKYVVLDATSLKFYTPGTTYKGIEVGTGGITIYRGWDATEQENLKGIEITPLGIDIYGSDQDNPDVMVTSDGIYMFKGGILSGTPGSTSDHFIYLSTEDLGSIYSSLDANKTDWREIIGNNFGVDSSGNLYATNAHLTGEVNATSGYIGTATNGFIIDSYGFYVGTKTSNTTNSIALSRQLFTRTIDGTSRSDLCFAIGSKFAVDKDGNLYANGANITNINVGTITISDISGLQNSLTYAQNNADYYFDDITNGVAVHNYTNTTQPDNRIEITSTNGLEIFNGGASVAQYGTTARIGQVANDQSRVEIKETGIDFYNRTSGIDIVLAHIGYDTGRTEGESTSTSKYPYYTFGLRDSDTSSTRGNYSVAEGNVVTASGYCSHAEGYVVTASGVCSHAEGYGTIASGVRSHAEGYGTVAKGGYSHAEGDITTASGLYSHAQNHGTIAYKQSQTAIGEYNLQDGTGSVTTRGAYAVIIGNGTSNTARSNALTVDWNGVARLKGNLFTGCNSDSTGGYEFGRKTDYHIVVGGIHICWGLESITHTGSGYKEVTITLPYTYTSAPRCFASYGNRLTSGAPRTAYATQGGLAGNKIYVASYATAACTAYVNWMTIGV